MILLKLTLHSMWNRRTSLVLVLLSIAISVALLISVDYVRKQAKTSFLSTISGTDLVVGARSSPIQLLLSCVFRIGNATHNISWQTYQTLAANPLIAWTIPITLGDSHKGFPVLGTNQDYFRYYQYADKRHLALASGKTFSDVFDVVIGAEVARKLNYPLNTKIVLAHGEVSTDFNLHEDKPFTVVGILKPTGTPIDRTLHISLEGIEALHVDWVDGAKVPGYSVSAEEATHKHLQPDVITAFLVGLKTRTTALRLQRDINDYAAEPLLATIPGLALAELWQNLTVFETALRVISGMVIIAGLISLLTVLLATLNERRREMAILRAVGAHPWQIIMLFVLEALILTLVGCLVAILVVTLAITVAQPWLLETYGFYLQAWWPDSNDLLLIGTVVSLSMLFSLLPGFIAYYRSLQDGLTIKI